MLLFTLAAKIDQDSMRAMLLLLSQGSVELLKASMFLTQNSTLLLLVLINQSTSLTQKSSKDTQNFSLRLKHCCIVEKKMLNTCKCLIMSDS